MKVNKTVALAGRLVGVPEDMGAKSPGSRLLYNMWPLRGQILLAEWDICI